MSAENKRDWVVLQPLIETDRRIRDYLRPLVQQEVANLGQGLNEPIQKVSVYPFVWHHDGNYSSIILRIEHPAGVVRRAYSYTSTYGGAEPTISFDPNLTLGAYTHIFKR